MCPYCKSRQIFRSRRRAKRLVFPLNTIVVALRCHTCMRHFYSRHWLMGGTQPFAERPEREQRSTPVPAGTDAPIHATRRAEDTQTVRPRRRSANSATTAAVNAGLSGGT